MEGSLGHSVLTVDTASIYVFQEQHKILVVAHMPIGFHFTFKYGNSWKLDFTTEFFNLTFVQHLSHGCGRGWLWCQSGRWTQEGVGKRGSSCFL